MGKKLPEDLTKVDRLDPTKAIQNEDKGEPPEKNFSSLMNPDGSAIKESQQQTNAPSPFDLAQGNSKQLAQPTPETLLGQMQSVSGVLGDVQNQLHTKNLKLKPSQKYLLRNKLNESNSQIRGAASKLGVDVGQPPSKSLRQNPAARFLSIVTDGQQQMQAAEAKIREIQKNPKSVNPGEMLMVQIKLAKAQQELEYSSVLLSKAVEDVKTLFNIQI